jgi:plasmid stabilization system protein ParE
VRKPKYQVLWTNTAKRDLEEIIGFIASENSRAAHAVAERLERRCSKLAQLPERGRVVPELKAVDIYVYRALIERPWRIVYRYERDRVYVMALLDARRNLISLLLERLARN